jgi:hypothetical protein
VAGTFDVELDDAELRRWLQRAERTLGDLTPAFQDIGELLIERTRARFRSGTAPDGTAWAPLSETTLERRAERGISGTRPGIGESRQLSTQWSYRILSGKQMIFGSPSIQSRVFDQGAEARSFTGGKTPWGDIPARRILGLSEQDRADILAILREHVDGDA